METEWLPVEAMSDIISSLTHSPNIHRVNEPPAIRPAIIFLSSSKNFNINILPNLAAGNRKHDVTKLGETLSVGFILP